MKGGDFSKVCLWYKMVLNNTSKLVSLLEAERGDIVALGMTMNVLKCGLLSLNAEVANLCARVINKICLTLHENAKTRVESQALLPVLWDWFVTGQKVPGVEDIQTPEKGYMAKIGNAKGFSKKEAQLRNKKTKILKR